MGVRKTIDRFLRHGLVGSLVRAIGSGSEPGTIVELRKIRRILFVRPNFRMGNLLLVTPGLAIARRALPEAELHLLTTSAYRSLLNGHPDVDRLLTFDRGMLLHPWSLADLIRRLRSYRYDLVIDCSEGESLTGALFARLSGGRRRVAPRSGRYRELYNVLVPLDPDLDHRIERLADLLAGIGIAVDHHEMSIALAASEREWAADRWRTWGFLPGDRVVGVNLGARGEKRWATDKFLRVIRRLREVRDVGVVVFAGPEDLDRLALVEDRLPDEIVVDTTDEVRRFAALLERCSLVVTGDTGPMHLAAALNVPTVSIFLESDHRTFAPIGSRHRCVRGGEQGVEPEDVLRAAHDVLDSIVESPAGGRR